MNEYKNRLETFLRETLSREPCFPPLQKALQYSVLDGGKRLRPLMVYITGRTFGATLDILDTPAAAVELIHCYSLIHDDLPSMDDDDLRRGKPTCHKMFDEATAILAGDALQSLAFEMMAEGPQTDAQKIKMISRLAKASGGEGMVGGQTMDLASQGKELTLPALSQLHSLKTGELFRAAIALGAIAANCDEKILAVLDDFAAKIGLAFQIQDDILDVEGCSQKLGKLVGADTKLAKATYPSLMGLSTAKQKVQELQDQSITLLKTLPCNTLELQKFSLQLTQREF
jgi:geranylgeranyl pyrophosphate synthase